MKRSIATHAHASQDKAARREVILRAASTLFVAGGGSLPTAAHIASAAGLAKGTVYLYFRTKEEIFAALLLQGWANVMDDIQRILLKTAGGRSARVAAFLSSLVAHIDLHPELLRLDALGYGILEKNMLHEALAEHKISFMASMANTAKVIDSTLRLASGRGDQLLMRTYALTRGLWQSYQHERETLLAGKAVPRSLTAKPFGAELHEALTEYWRGALASRPGSKQ